MDLFGPTSVRSLNHKTYYLVITDDFSRGLIEFRELLRRATNGTEALLIPTLFILWLDKVITDRPKVSTDGSKVSTDNPLFDEIPEDTVDHMETENAQNEGRTREMVDEDKEIDENILSTEDVLSTDKEGVSTDRPKVSTDGSKVSTDRHIEGTDEQVEGTEEHNKGTEEHNECTEEKI
ncbi:hypothetical protein Tco_0187033, partial [Tanacetum coccineum]